MKIKLNNVYIENQDEALNFYTEKLGFVKKTEIPLRESNRLTVVSPEGHDNVELLLEPNSMAAANAFQKALFEQGIPLTAFAVDDIHAEFEKLKERDVTFTMEPTTFGDATLAVFDDTCGNLIQIYQN